MFINQNVVHDHGNPHAISDITNFNRQRIKHTADLAWKHQFTQVIAAMADSPANLYLLPWLDRRLIIKSRRVLNPVSLDHWTPGSFGKGRLVVHVEPGVRAFTSILFDVSGPGDQLGTIKASILDLRHFNKVGMMYDAFAAFNLGAAPLDAIVDDYGNIQVGRPGHMIQPDVTACTDRMAGILTWFGGVLADPTVFRHIDLTQSLEYLE